jgi:hypothetical protein
MGVFSENGLDRLTELADPFAVDDAEFENLAFPTQFEVIEQNRLDIFRTKGVKIQNAIDGQLDRIRVRRGTGLLVHKESLYQWQS